MSSDVLCNLILEHRNPPSLHRVAFSPLETNRVLCWQYVLCDILVDPRGPTTDETITLTQTVSNLFVLQQSGTRLRYIKIPLQANNVSSLLATGHLGQSLGFPLYPRGI